MTTGCIKCGRPLGLKETAICDKCVIEVQSEGKRNKNILAILFNGALFAFVYYYFFMR